MVNASQRIGNHDILFITLDTLRYDVAARLHGLGRTPNLSGVLPPGGWERRHSPESFTFAAHAAFFAGFFPTPARPGRHPRPFALRFPGSETTTSETAVLDGPDLMTGLHQRGYRTICIGGVGFFNKLTPLGTVLPRRFHEIHWSSQLAADCFASAVVGVDLVFERGFRRHFVLEVNAFGDFFPGWIDAAGRSIHALEIEETIEQNRWRPGCPSEQPTRGPSRTR